MRQSKRLVKSSSSAPRSFSSGLSLFARSFIKRVQNTVSSYDLWKPHQSFIVAVSGGPDSMCLLDVLVRLSKQYSFLLHVAHVNYRLRGKESDLDERLVRQQALQYGLECIVFKPKKSKHANLEERLREERYVFFEKIRKTKHADAIVIAHNEDDQAETFLLRLLRGAGLEGLAAIRPRNGFFVRPFLQMNRVDILRYLAEQKIPFREDASNHDRSFMRNRVRHELIPFIEKSFQPKIKKLLAKNALLIADDYTILQQIAGLYGEAEVLGRLKKQYIFSCSDLMAYPRPILRFKLRALVKPFFSGKAKESGFIHEIIKSLESGKGKIQTVSCNGLKFIRKGDTVTLLISESKKKK